MNVTICAAVSDNPKLHFDKVQFDSRRQYPVEAHYIGSNNGENGWASTGLSFGDYRNMQTGKRHIVGRERKLATPEFMLDQTRFRAVVVRFLEIRVQLRRQEGTEVERLQKLTPLLKRRAEHAMAQLDKWCAMYVAATDDAERKRCQRRIEEYDTTVRICQQPGVIPQMARCYYFEGLNSKAVGERVGFKAPHVRQILYRLGRLDAEMQAGTERKRSSGCAQGGRVSAHTRHHVNRGVFSPNCALCAQGAQNLLVGARQAAGNQSQHV